MKNIIYTVFLLIAMLLVSCDMGSETVYIMDSDEAGIVERISLFENDLNADNYDTLNTHFHTDMINFNNYMSTKGLFRIGYLRSNKREFSFSKPQLSISDNGYYALGNLSNNEYSDLLYLAEMKKDDNVWKILSLTVSGDSTFYDIRALK